MTLMEKEKKKSQNLSEGDQVVNSERMIDIAVIMVM